MLILHERERLLSAPRHRSFERIQTAQAECARSSTGDTDRQREPRHRTSVKNAQAGEYRLSHRRPRV